MTKKQNKTLVATLVVAVIAIGAYYLWNNKQNADKAALESAQNTEANSTTTPAPTPKPATPSSKAYTDAIAIYGKTGYRLQFAKDCLATPGSLVIKKGAKFMLDNRDSLAHTLVVKSQTFHLAAYGFAIVTATEVGEYSITCDKNPRVSLNVEK